MDGHTSFNKLGDDEMVKIEGELGRGNTSLERFSGENENDFP